MHACSDFNLQKHFKIQDPIWRDAECFLFSADKPTKRYRSVCIAKARVQPQRLIYWAKKQSLLQLPCRRTHCLQQNFSKDCALATSQGALSVSQARIGSTYGWTECCFFFFATSTFPLPGLLCFQFWGVNSLKTSALLEMFCAFSKPHPHGGYVVTKNRQSCIMQACKQEKVAKRGCWTLGPHRMELYTTWASLTLSALGSALLYTAKRFPQQLPHHITLLIPRRYRAPLKWILLSSLSC